jgi:hypothetical protein
MVGKRDINPHTRQTTLKKQKKKNRQTPKSFIRLLPSIFLGYFIEILLLSFHTFLPLIDLIEKNQEP